MKTTENILPEPTEPSLTVSPQGLLHLENADDKLEDLRKAFVHGSGHGLLFLDTVSAKLTEDSVFAYWKDFARLYLSLFASAPDLEDRDLEQAPLSIALQETDYSHLLLTVPPMKGAEYVNMECLRGLWQTVENALHEEILAHGNGIPAYFAARHSGWSLLGRVCFHLAENKRDPDTPFAFLATYAHRVSSDGKPKHLPLNRALEEYAQANQRPLLLRLLAPINKATQECAFLKKLTNSGDIYHPLAWTEREAYQFLKDVPVFEKAGIAVKVPDWWNAGKIAKPEIKVTIGDQLPSYMGTEVLLDFNASLTLDDKALNMQDIQDLLARSENLLFFKGRWVEVDREKLTDLLDKWKAVQRQMKEGGVTFAEGMRWLSGMDAGGENSSAAIGIAAHARVACGPWLKKTLHGLRSPEENRALQKTLDKRINADLRPYQRQGIAWLHLLHQLQLGAILADDMGLGKTLQTLSLLTLMQSHKAGSKSVSLLILPASLIGNWKTEIRRFAPGLTYHVAHPSGDGIKDPTDTKDIIIVTYGMVARLPWLSKRTWSLIAIDEAQAIKNPNARQTKAVKALKASHRLVLTGTPVENRLSDLWSLFDFASPGLLGSAKEFDKFMKKKDERGNPPHAALRILTRPYILRRLKTDKSIISDLPDKTEMKTYCQLTKAQAALYKQAVEKLALDLKSSDGIQRRGIILSYLMRFKQICNHPSQWVKDNSYAPQDSGKFLRLRDISEVIAEKQEKVLVFTQFKEMIEPLAAFLRDIFGREGLILHGGMPVGKRPRMVAEFQRDEGSPFFVLSLKAGGTGLNLTAASHVIHFDRWWNPAVENQATDRAFRIGQKRNVLVHKFICKGTLEERIDEIIESKRALSGMVMENTGGALLTEMSNKALLKLVTLNIKSAEDTL
ncbi:MAG: DEAD/DEAH box helicase [Alphaproteobacteria bacterium]|nr:DEAD/DEAH box helicase [Alphaproteobacteria bacterium]